MPAAHHARARVGRWLLALNVLVSAMALGALHTPVLALSATLAALAAGLVWYGAEPLRPRPAATLIVVLGAGLILWTALQAVPLPRALVEVIAPTNADVWARSLAPLREDGPALVTLSLDPTATRVQVLRGVTYLLMFIAAVRVAHRPNGIAFLERALVFAGIAMAAAALLHPVFGAEKVFGAYKPGETYAFAPRHIAPLLNANHLAGYVNIGALVALAAAVRKSESMPRVVAMAAALLLIAANVWAASRGGTAALVLGTVVTIGLAVGARKSERAKLVSVGATVAVMVASVFLIVVSASDDARGELASADLGKLQMFREAMRIVPSYPLTGIGRGTFESVFPSVKQGMGYWVHTHPENLVAQWFTEWGVPVAVAAFAAVGWALRPSTVLARSQPPVGAWAAIAALAVHNLVDFSTEVPGVMVALAVCAAIVTGGGAGRSSPREARRLDLWSSRPKVLAVLGAVAALASVGLTVPFTSVELYNEQREIKDLVLDRSLPREAFNARLRQAMTRHPAEAYFPFIGAVRASVTREESVVPWVARALDRSPVYGRAHLLLARGLYRRNPSQARLEYRLAAEQDENLATAAATEAAPLVTGFDDALEIAPPGVAGVQTLEVLAQTLAPRMPATVLRIDREIASRSPASLAPERRAARATLADLRNKEPWCEPQKECLGEGLLAATRIQKATPSKCEGFALAAELRIAAGEVEEGLIALERAADNVSDRSECVRRFVRASLDAKRERQTDAAVERLVRLGCEAVSECVENLIFAASIEETRGHRRGAIAHYKRAWERSPDRDDLLQNVARLAAAERMHGEALDAYSKLAARARSDQERDRWAQAAAAEKAALQASVYENRK
jgi:tetratricopeptide (TPR) repeat protein